MKMGAEPFKDPKVRKAMKLAIDAPTILKIAYRDLGAPGDHHHVCPVHPDYAEVPVMTRDVEAAKKLLAEPVTRTASRSSCTARRTRIGSPAPARRWSSSGPKPASR